MSRAHKRYERNNLALPLPLGNVFRVTYNMTLQLQNVQIHFDYGDSGTIMTGSTETEIANAADTALSAALQACMTTDVKLQSIVVACMTDTTRKPQAKSLALLTGSVVDTPCETFEAVVVVRQTAQRTACGRGRLYIPGWPRSYVTNGQVFGVAASAALATLLTQMQVVLATAGGRTSVPGIFSFGSYKHKTKGFSQLTFVDFNRFLGTCRHRKIGRGK